MSTVSIDELKKIAKLSVLKVEQAELEGIALHLEELVKYCAQLLQAKAPAGLEPVAHNINVFRDDRPTPCEALAVLASAPGREDSFFVVPKIL